MKKILLVEDDFSLGNSIKETLLREGFSVTLAPSLSLARQEDTKSFDIILLDWMLPDGQGIDLLREFRAQSVITPVIMLTARTDLIDKVLGLESGASDYVTKPFEPRELVARIRVQLRDRNYKGHEIQDNDRVNYGPLEMDTNNRTCNYEGKEIILTKMEFDLLYLLVTNPKTTFSREKLLDKVWGLENYPTTRTVDTHVLQLRQKIDSELIDTVRGIGYRLGALHNK